MTDVLRRTALWIVPAYALLFLTYIDGLDPAGSPRIALTGTIALIAWAFAESGQTLGITTMAAVLLVVLVTRTGPSRRRRLLEIAVMIVTSLLLLYGGKLLNDHVIKPAIDVHRPNIVELAELDLLGMDAESFYEMPKQLRSDHLDSIKTADGFGDIEMRPEVRDHWVKETAFSRPSGHSLASFTFATLYLSIAMASVTGRRRWPFIALVPWAVGVCYSRAILRVHWPTDIVLGALAGIAIGAAGFLVAQSVLDRLDPPPPT